MRKSASGGDPGGHAAPPPGGPPSLPTAASWRPGHRPALRNPQGPGPRGDAPSKSSLLREERPSRGALEPPAVGKCSQPGGPHTRPKLRLNVHGEGPGCRADTADSCCLVLRCVPAGPPASGAGGGGGPTRGASCLELTRHWTGAVPGAPWCRDPREGPQGPKRSAQGWGVLGVGTPGGSGQRALGGHWGAKGGLWGVGPGAG